MSIRLEIGCVLAAVLTIGCITSAIAQDSPISSYSTEQGLSYSTEQGVESVDVLAIQAVPAHANKSTDEYRLWVGTNRGLREYFDSAFHEPQITHGTDAVIVTNAVISASINALLAVDGTLWIGADTGLHRRNADGSWETNLEKRAGLDTVEITRSVLPAMAVSGLAVTRALFVGTVIPGPG